MELSDNAAYPYAYEGPPEPDFGAGLYLVRHTGPDEGAHHGQDEDVARCPHCFRSLNVDAQCWVCDGGIHPLDTRSEDELTHPRNAQEALLAVQYVEFRAMFEDDS